MLRQEGGDKTGGEGEGTDTIAASHNERPFICFRRGDQKYVSVTSPDFKKVGALRKKKQN